MSNRLPPVCESAPAPAILAWQDAGHTMWELNTAAKGWGLGRFWQAAEWAAIARSVIEHARSGRLEGDDCALGLRWVAIDVDGAWLAWLMPAEDAYGVAEQLRERDRALDVTQSIELIAEAKRAAEAVMTPVVEPADSTPTIDVLYIEDNAINVLLVEELLTMRPNVRLHVAVDGRSGIARARALKPRAVLVDLQLPDIDGFEVLRALRSDASLDKVTLIALSANATPEDIERARALGFDDYWTKPIDFGRFLGGLDRLAGSATCR